MIVFLCSSFIYQKQQCNELNMYSNNEEHQEN